MSAGRLETGRAIVAARATEEQPDATEIRRLAESAGYAVVEEVTQRRREDPGTWLGRGKADEVADLAAETDADALVVDGGLNPGQYADLVDVLPAGVEPVDRYRLVLDVFADGTADERAALQVEAAALRYQLPRLRQVTKLSALSKANEKGSPVFDVEDRIDAIDNKLDELVERAAERRESRRREGFGLVAIAGYTNAGKTTLLHRLADDLALDDDAGHDDLTDAAPVEDRLFVTLETVTRRGTADGLDVAYTDTVGLIEALPHDLVESFSATLDEAAAADVTLLVVDATDDPERVREKVEVSVEALDAERSAGEDVDHAADRPTLVGVLNKVDAVDDVEDRREAVADAVDDVVAVSALDGTGLDDLEARVRDGVPTETTTLELPNDGEGQRTLSWLYDHGTVEAVDYGDRVTVTVTARPGVLERAVSRARDAR